MGKNSPKTPKSGLSFCIFSSVSFAIYLVCAIILFVVPGKGDNKNIDLILLIFSSGFAIPCLVFAIVEMITAKHYKTQVGSAGTACFAFSIINFILCIVILVLSILFLVIFFAVILFLAMTNAHALLASGLLKVLAACYIAPCFFSAIIVVIA